LNKLTAVISKKSQAPYKSYVAVLNQSSDSFPSADVLYNNFTETFTWERISAGEYRLVSSGLTTFPLNKTAVFISSGINDGDPPFVTAFRSNDSTIGIHTIAGGFFNDEYLDNTTFEIRVYN
jgi:hypothetical protein